MNKLSDETMIEILMYLRATELATLAETNKEVFSRYRIGMAIQRIIKESPTLINATSPFKKHILRIQQANGLLRPESLYVFEVANILSALTFPQPLFGKGYWISASWASNAKKYFEAVPMGDMVENALLSLQMPANTTTSSTNTPTPQKGHKNVHKQHHYNRSGDSSPVVVANFLLTNTPQKTPISSSTPSSPAFIPHPTTPLPNITSNCSSPAMPLTTPKQHQQSSQPQRSIGKSSKIRQRRGSDALPPWPNMNAELTCIHNGLSSHKIPNAKRKAVAGVAWRMLRRYYPLGESFHIAHVHECAQCLSQTDEAKQLAQEKKESTLQIRKKQWCPPALQALNQRAKQGVPSDRLVSSHHMYLLEEIDEDGQVVHFETVPLPSSALVQAASLPPLPPPAAGTLQNVSGTTTTASGSRSDSPLTSTSTVQAITAANTTASAVNDQIATVDNNNVSNIDNANNSVANNSNENVERGTRDAPPSTHWPIPLPEFTYPLLPGVYFLIPRDWLKQWRRFIKDATVTQAPQITPAMDCTRLLCHRHGHLLVPHHLEEYLVGIKRSLLTGLGEYLGEVVEIVTPEEWETLSNICYNTNHSNSYSGNNDMPAHASSLSRARSSDFSVSFTIDVSRNDLRSDEPQQQHYQLQWNIPVCHVCDPLDMVREENARTWR